MQKEEKYDENRDLWENGVQLVTTNIQNKMLQLLYNENRQSALIYSDMQHITRNMIIISLFLAAFLVVVTTMMITIIPRSISKPVRYLSSITKEVADGNLEVRAHMEHGVDVKLLADSLNVMIEKIKTLIDNVMLEQMRLREAELEILQMQINPHFLYNTLDTIVWLAEAGQKEQVVSMVQTLSDFFRASLNSGKDIVSLEGECRHITSYLQIQQVRYQDILTYDVDIPEEIANCKIPKITLQPLVENALYHGIKNKRGKGRIVVTGRREKDKCVIRVEDNGIGIARDEQSRIFERFYQARNNNSPQKSIGIGLSLVKHIVTLHHGEIEVASELNVGSLFRVRIPKGCAHLAPEQIKDSDKVPGRPFQNLPIGMDSALSDFGDDQFESEMAAETAIGNDRGMQCGLLEENTRHGAAASDGKRVSILVAEDNTALRDYLRSALENRYNVSTARNGEEAYCQAINEQPDLVLTDIVMPGMSGIELCRKIKENSRTSAIGVILLTAHNLQNYEVSGYRVGADAYVAKPFSLEVLFSRIDNLVARQNKIHKNSQPIKEIPISEVAVEKSEDLFLVKCTETIETEIADPRFDVLQLCRKIGVSRSQLYRRILALTGLTPIQFIRSIRLKHAASFLAQDGTLPVNEVMYRVGYTNLSHFAKIFHEEFGLYPKEFALRNRSKTGKVDSASEIFSKNEPETQK